MIKQQSILGTIVNYIGVGIGYINTILLFPLYFSPEEYGLTRVLLSIGIFLTQLSQMGLSQTIIKFMPYFRNNPAMLFGFYKWIVQVFIIGMIPVSLILFFGNDFIIDWYAGENPKYLAQYFYLLFPLVLFLTCYEITDSLLKSYFRTVASTAVKEIFIRLSISALIGLYYFKYLNFYSFMIGFVAIYAVAFVSIFFLLLPYLNFKNKPLKISPIRKSLQGYMWRYGSFALLTGAGTILINNIDIIMLGYMIHFEAVAVYTVSFYITVLIQIPQRNLNRIITPILSENYRKKDFEKISVLHKKSAWVLFFIGSFLFSGIWVNMDALFEMMPKSEIYKQGKWVVFLIGISKLIDMMAGVHSEIISVSKFYVFNFTALVLLIVAATLLNIWLIPIFQTNGAALATLIAIVLYNLLKLIYLYQKMKLHPFSLKLVPVLLLLIFFLIFPLFKFSLSDSIVLKIIFQSTIVLAMYGIAAYFMKVHSLLFEMRTPLKK